jgi:Tfp pilus assembly protein PilV
LEKDITTKSLRRFKEGFILLESLVAISVLTVGILYYQDCQLQLVKKSQQAYQDVAMLRTLYEEVSQYRQMSVATPYTINQKNQRITITTQTHTQATIASKNRSWSIYRET